MTVSKDSVSKDSIPATVYLVGAGPGDPGLLTLAGADVLRRAAVVVYDYLANPELLNLAPPAAERIYVGKSGVAGHSKTQDQINAILLEKAREHSQLETRNSKLETPSIVRLKGGDPYVFGRGGEEGEFLRQHHIPFVEIPGITSGIAAPAYAGIPVTHRDFASTITLITGHERGDSAEKRADEGEASHINYEALAKLEGTLIFYMGIKSLPLIAERLMSAGLDAQTPAAVIRWGTRANQETVTGTVATIAEAVQKAGIKAPAITIVGKVVALRPALDWFEQRPLFGHRFLVTRTRQQASELSNRLASLGAQVLEAPTIELQPPAQEEWPEIDRLLQQIPAFDWVIFTSPNGVRAAWERLKHLTFDARHFGASNVAAIGSATAEALGQIGITPDLVPEQFVAEKLAVALKAHIAGDSEAVDTDMRGKRFLLLRADIARPVLREELEKMGGIVEDLPIYRTVKPERLPEEVTAFLSEPTVNPANPVKTWVTFTSASTANNLWELLAVQERQKVATFHRASIGPITSAALAKLGHGEWKPTHEAAEHSIDGLVRSILDHTMGAMKTSSVK